MPARPGLPRRARARARAPRCGSSRRRWSVSTSTNLGGRQRRDGPRPRRATTTPRARSTSPAGTCSAGRRPARLPRCSAACSASGFPLYFAVPLGSVDEMTDYVAARRVGGHPPLPAQDRRRPARGRRAYAARRRGDRCRTTSWSPTRTAAGGCRTRSSRLARSRRSPRVFLEQPCPTLEECLDRAQRTTLPMVSTSRIHDVHTLLRAYEAKAMEAINLKVSKVGGLTQAQADARPRAGARAAADDRGHVGRRPRDGGGRAPRREHASPTRSSRCRS